MFYVGSRRFCIVLCSWGNELERYSPRIVGEQALIERQRYTANAHLRVSKWLFEVFIVS